MIATKAAFQALNEDVNAIFQFFSEVVQLFLHKGHQRCKFQHYKTFKCHQLPAKTRWIMSFKVDTHANNTQDLLKHFSMKQSKMVLKVKLHSGRCCLKFSPKVAQNKQLNSKGQQNNFHIYLYFLLILLIIVKDALNMSSTLLWLIIMYSYNKMLDNALIFISNDINNSCSWRSFTETKVYWSFTEKQKPNRRGINDSQACVTGSGRTHACLERASALMRQPQQDWPRVGGTMMTPRWWITPPSRFTVSSQH